MTVAQVVIRAGKTGWRNVGSAHPHKRGGGWNILLTDEAPDATLVLMDNGGYAPGTTLRVLVTRPAEDGGTQWYRVGYAWISQAGRALLVTLDTELPEGERKIVILPNKVRA